MALMDLIDIVSDLFDNLGWTVEQLLRLLGL